jgi:hypothetical protein
LFETLAKDGQLDTFLHWRNVYPLP